MGRNIGRRQRLDMRLADQKKTRQKNRPRKARERIRKAARVASLAERLGEKNRDVAQNDPMPAETSESD